MKNCCMSCILWQGMGSAGCSVPGAMLPISFFILTHDSPSLHRKFLQPHPNIICLSYIYEKKNKNKIKVAEERWCLNTAWLLKSDLAQAEVMKYLILKHVSIRAQSIFYLFHKLYYQLDRLVLVITAK